MGLRHLMPSNAQSGGNTVAHSPRHEKGASNVTKLSLTLSHDMKYYASISTNNNIMVASTQIAILTKVVELARRFGLRASDYVAEYHFDNDHDRIIFTGTPTNQPALERYERMLEALGGDFDTQEVVTNNVDELEDRLDKALSLAPRARSF